MTIARAIGRLSIASALLAAAVPARSEMSEFDRKSTFFAGGGLFAGAASLAVQDGGSSSRYALNGFAAEAGLSVPFTRRFGLQASTEYALANAVNLANGSSSMEAGSWSGYGAKAGFFYGLFTAGGGLRSTTVSLKSISSGGSTTSRDSNVNGTNPFAFGVVSFDLNGRFRAAVEGQYSAGTLQSSGGSGAPVTVTYSEVAGTIRVFLLLD